MFSGRRLTVQELKKLRRRFYALGFVQLVVGVLALLKPLAASLAIETFVGALFLVVGFFQGWNAFVGFREGEKPWQQTFVAAITFIAGLTFLFHPFAGVITLSIFLAAYFMVDGVMKVMEFFRVRSLKGAFWVLLSGVLGIILAIMMWSNYLRGAAILGIVFGVNFTFAGIAFILLARSCSEKTGTCGLPESIDEE